MWIFNSLGVTAPTLPVVQESTVVLSSVCKIFLLYLPDNDLFMYSVMGGVKFKMFHIQLTWEIIPKNIYFSP